MGAQLSGVLAGTRPPTHGRPPRTQEGTPTGKARQDIHRPGEDERRVAEEGDVREMNGRWRGQDVEGIGWDGVKSIAQINGVKKKSVGELILMGLFLLKCSLISFCCCYE